MSNYISSKDVVTRKEHQCFSCYRVFPKGTKMNRNTSSDMGTIFTVHSCMTCNTIIESEREDEYPDGYVDGMLRKGQTPEDLLQELKLHECSYLNQ